MGRISDWENGLDIPKTPKGATHAQIRCGKQKATVLAKDFSAFKGVEGIVSWAKQKKNSKTIELMGEEFKWDGFKVE
jgi:hypothetical protein